MTNSLFQKMMFFTDSHFGRGGNNTISNQDNLDFIDWAIDRTLSWGGKDTTVIFGGDWFDNRNSIHLSTMHYSLKGLDKLSKSFNNIFWLRGNHDELFRDKREITSIEFLKYLPNIRVINEPTTIDDITFLSWLFQNEYKSIKGLKSRYVFGHLEMPGFKMNAAVIMPDSPHLLKHDQFLNQEYVFCGHYHIRQIAGNVIYTGNIMPFNFSDVDDTNRGIMLLKYGGEPIFEAWPEQPLFTTAKLSDLLDKPNTILKPKMTIKALVDVPLAYEEVQEIRDMFELTYGVRKLELKHPTLEIDQDFKEDIIFKSVDQIVIDGIMSVESTGISPDRLAEIYKILI